MMHSVVIYSCIAGAATMLGITLVQRNSESALKHSNYLNSLAAGFILAVAFFHLMPEATEMTDDAMFAVGCGFIIFYLLETVLVVHSGVEMHFHSDGDCHAQGHAKALVAFSGLLFHSFLDGIIMAVAFKADEHSHGHLGLLAAISVILHELPEGMTTFSLLLRGTSRQRAKVMSIAVALATPLGAVLSMVFAPDLDRSTYGILIGIAAGSFLYVGASDLVPETHGKYGLRNAVCLLAGAGLVYIAGMLVQVHAH